VRAIIPAFGGNQWSTATTMAKKRTTSSLKPVRMCRKLAISGLTAEVGGDRVFWGSILYRRRNGGVGEVASTAETQFWAGNSDSSRRGKYSGAI